MNSTSQNNEFKSLLNFRDIGGTLTSDNKRIKKGIVYRSANPDRLGKHDLSTFLDLNIKTIIDLRASHEVSKKKIPIDHSEILTLPLDFQQKTRERMKPVIRKRGAQEIIAEISNSLYLEILDEALQVFREVMEVLSSPARTPVLIHCHAGKDRTGIIIALIMLAMGVEKDPIVRDFMKSNDALLPSFRRHFLMRSVLHLGFFPYRNLVFAVTVKQRNIESILERVQIHYGGIEAYLSLSGFDLSRMKDVRERLLEE